MNKYYISFGQTHVHYIGNNKTADKDCIVVIEANNYEEAREKAFKCFKGVFHNVYKELPDMSFFPKGLIEI